MKNSKRSGASEAVGFRLTLNGNAKMEIPALMEIFEDARFR